MTILSIISNGYSYSSTVILSEPQLHAESLMKAGHWNPALMSSMTK